MVQGAMVLSKGVRWSKKACTIQCNSSLISTMERSIGFAPSQSEPISTFDGHAF
jgi:hypothetical protein